jgi:hypothetical protein
LRGTCPAHLILLLLITLIILGERVQIMKLPIMHLSPSSYNIIILSALFSNTLSLWPSLNVRGQVSHA